MIMFQPENAALIILGLKWQTRRCWKNGKNGKPMSRAKVGSLHYAQLNLKPESRFARLLVTSVDEWIPFTITKAEAKAEGFDSPDAFFKAYNAINAHKPYDPNRTHWGIEFKVISVFDSFMHPEVVSKALENTRFLIEDAKNTYGENRYGDYQ